MTFVRIDRRFRGPPDSGNGGYFAGLLAAELGGSDVLVTLKRPAPLEVQLRIDANENGATLWRGDELLAVAERGTTDVAVPPPPLLGEAQQAEDRFDQAAHIYPGCFVCGPARRPGDGWRIFAGPVDRGRVAACWQPAEEFGLPDGTLAPQFVWAALDCPGYFAVNEAAGLALLGQMAVHIHQPVPFGHPLIVHGWAIGSNGRKHHAGTALHDAEGTLLAAATQTWITLR